MSKEKYEIMRIRAQNWCSKVIECEEENELLLARVKELEKNNSKIDFEHEKILMRKDAEIERLKSSLEDYKERYAELKADYKDLRKS